MSKNKKPRKEYLVSTITTEIAEGKYQIEFIFRWKQIGTYIITNTSSGFFVFVESVQVKKFMHIHSMEAAKAIAEEHALRDYFRKNRGKS